MRKIHVTLQFFEAGGPQGHFFEKTKKPVLRYGLGECLYQISGLYHFSFGQGDAYEPTDKQTNTRIQVKIRISSTGCSPRLYFDIKYGYF